MKNLFALAAILSGGAMARAEAPAFQADYATARQQCETAKKPLAVFVGKGENGWSKVADEACSKRLSADYVCVYADTATESGRQLASKLELKQDAGLVISDRSGRYEAYRHDGSLSAIDLARTVEKFATVETISPNRSVSNYAPDAPMTTSVPAMNYPGIGQPSTSYYPQTSSCANGSCGASASYYPQTAGCPGGNCAASSGGGRRRR